MMRRTTRIMKMTITVMLVQGPLKGRTAPHSPPTCFLSEEVIPYVLSSSSSFLHVSRRAAPLLQQSALS